MFADQPLECYACGGVFRRRELIGIDEIPGYRWPRYCPSCAVEIRAAHARACLLCGAVYMARLATDPPGLCPGCSSDERLRELARVKYHLARARELNLPATLTLRQWLAHIDYFDHLCAYCQASPYTDLDHFVPLAAGGGTTAGNCLPACARCNAAKGMHDPNHAAFDHHPAATVERLRTYLAQARGD